MYNKIFTKILDSSIWLTSDATRLVWITFLAAMDEDGFVQYATVGNVANRARVSMEQAQLAIDQLEAPEPSTATEEDDGRRIERVPGGWMVLNAPKYRDMVHRAAIKEQTRVRVANHRAKKRAAETDGNESVRTSNAPVTQSDTPSDSATTKRGPSDGFEVFWNNYPNKVKKKDTMKIWAKLKPSPTLQLQIIQAITRQRESRKWKEGFVPDPTTFLNQERWNDELPGAASSSTPASVEELDQLERDLGERAGLHFEVFRDQLAKFNWKGDKGIAEIRGHFEAKYHEELI